MLGGSMVSRAWPTLLGRYRVLRELAQEVDSRVLLVEDLRQGCKRCALKLTHDPSPAALASLRQEFETLRRLRHRGLADVLEFGRCDPGELQLAGEPAVDVEGFRAFLTTAYYEGLDLRQGFRWLLGAASPGPGAPLPTAKRPADPWPFVYLALARVCETLHALHERGLLHLDVKPENMILLPVEAQGVLVGLEVKLLDLGLALNQGTPVGTRARGTLPYIAPELLKGLAVSRQADLFSLGVAATQALTGRFPLPGEGPEQWLSASLAGQVLPSSGLGTDLPAELAALIDRLLQPDPARRPSDAGAVVRELERMGRFSLPPQGNGPALHEPLPRAGWEREAAVIEAEVEQMCRGASPHALVLIEGEAGQYPERVLEEARYMAAAAGALAISGTCRQPRRSAYPPFTEMLEQVAREVDLAAPRFARFDWLLDALIPHRPRRVRPVAAPPGPLPARLAILRFLDTAVELFLEIARLRPLLLCFRDLHHAGRETLDLIRALGRSLQARSAQEDFALSAASSPSPGARLLLVASHTSGHSAEEDGEGRSDFDQLRELESETFTARVRLHDLGLERLADWLGERCPGLRPTPDLLRRIHEKTGGSPWLLDEFLHRLPPEPNTVGSAGKGDMERTRAILDALREMPRDPVEAALERLRGLSRTERGLLEVIAACPEGIAARALALVGAPVSPAQDGAPWEDDAATVRSAVTRLLEEGYVETDAPTTGDGAALEAGTLLTVKVGALETAIRRQTPEVLRIEIHRRIAVVLERLASSDANPVHEDIAFHARLAGMTDLFVNRGLHAARALLVAQAHDAAGALLRALQEHLALDDSAASRGPVAGPVRQQIGDLLATIHMAKGQMHKALEELTLLAATREIQKQPLWLSSVFQRLGEAYLHNGEAQSAQSFFEQGLQALAGPGADGATSLVSPEVATAFAREECQCLLALSRCHLLREQVPTAESLLARSLDTARRAQDGDALLAQAHRVEAVLRERLGQRTAALEAHRQAIALAERAGQEALLFDSLIEAGSCHLGRGEHGQAENCFQRAVAVARRLQSKYDLATATTNLGTLHHNRSDPQKALELFSESLLLSTQLGDIKGIAKSFNNLGLVHRLKDDLPRAGECYKRAIDLFSRLNDQVGMATGMSNLSSILELEGKYNEALDYSFRALEKRKKSRSRSGIAFSHYRIGKIYQAKGEFDKALSHAEKSLQIRRELGERLGIAHSQLQVAELLLGQGRLADALRMAEAGLKDFGDLDNEIGALTARELIARTLIGVGALSDAQEQLEKVLMASRDREQKILAGTCLLDLGRIAAETGEPREALDILAEAERLLRSTQSRRELCEVILESCACHLAAGKPDKAAERLEEAYTMLEDLGARDLIPRYFLLRGRIELERPELHAESTRQFLERGLIEAREIQLPELEWRLLLTLGQLASRQGDGKAARIHVQDAQHLLEDLQRGLPERLQSSFFLPPVRQEPRRLLSSVAASPTPLRLAAEPVAAGKPDPTARDYKPPELDMERAMALHHESLKLREVASAMGQESDVQKLLELVMDAVLELVNAERGFMILTPPPQDEGRGSSTPRQPLTVARNLDKEEILEPEGKLSHSVSRQVLQTGRPMLLKNAVEDSRFAAAKSVRDLRLRSLLCVPLRFRAEILGVLYVDNRHRRDAFQRRDMQLLQAFADQAAVAVKNAQLLEENRFRQTELAAAQRRADILSLKLRRKVHKRTAELAIVREDLRERQSQLEERHRFSAIVGKSEAILEILFLLERVSPTPLPILIEGESGTGKELIARAAHYGSLHKEGCFVSLSCGALAETLLESELFGHVRGAFTGAVADKKGLFELADGGTLFLDDVSEMSLGMQQKLLRVIQEGAARRVGGKEEIQVDVRLISACRQSLRSLVADGRFREDLYYRLNGVRIRVPSLRDRREDIPLLVEHFLTQGQRPEVSPSRFSAAALRLLMAQEWHGNVRELRHVVERTVLVAPGPVVQPGDVLLEPQTVSVDNGPSPRPPAPPVGSSSPPAMPPAEDVPLRTARDAFEKQFLEAQLAATGGNVAAAARACSISRESFYRLLRKYKLSWNSQPDEPTGRSPARGPRRGRPSKQ